MEDFKKNFILLSKVAKEKKYAQEYLGLLARRGDIGSIRIGKRWYTTIEWFSEFLRDAEARKVEAKSAEAKIELAEKEVAREIRIKKVFLPEKVELKLEKADEEKLEIEEKPVSLKFVTSRPDREKKLETIDLRVAGARKFPVLQKSPAEKINSADMRIKKYAWQNAAAAREEMAQEWKIHSGNSSPNFAESALKTPLLQKFAFSMSVVLILILLFQTGLVYKNELKSIVGIDSGIVAGAESAKLNLAVVKNSSLDYLVNQGGKIKENISLSRVLVRAAVEKNNEQGSVANDQ